MWVRGTVPGRSGAYCVMTGLLGRHIAMSENDPDPVDVVNRALELRLEAVALWEERMLGLTLAVVASVEGSADIFDLYPMHDPDNDPLDDLEDDLDDRDDLDDLDDPLDDLLVID